MSHNRDDKYSVDAAALAFEYCPSCGSPESIRYAFGDTDVEIVCKACDWTITATNITELKRRKVRRMNHETIAD